MMTPTAPNTNSARNSAATAKDHTKGSEQLSAIQSANERNIIPRRLI